MSKDCYRPMLAHCSVGTKLLLSITNIGSCHFVLSGLLYFIFLKFNSRKNDLHFPKHKSGLAKCLLYELVC